MLKNATDLDFFTDQIKGTSWVGLCFTDNRWIWLDGTESRSVTIRYNTHCAALYKSKLYDWKCADQNHWICEKRAVQLLIKEDFNILPVSISGMKHVDGN
ncbi:killer cell lectin-like receptor subfamily B member 1B allele B [Microcaecilia unicolor]|uniref:Killer cell lectin-like receptor subfamily B member 1B allele B n=1 Tax=Microcaecilia unicolor TaxID=1415580 RepID=A0A6P7XDA7_9AMPH|nr:killer cell lectin-like receptor subfamily B member 1B allele B [Microcaecilia unicolor]